MRSVQWMRVLVVGVVALVAGRLAAAQDEPFPIPKPTAEHEIFKADVGTWDASIKSWMDPSAEPLESKGVETNTLLPGGLWLLSEFKGEFANLPFEGRGQTSYDAHKKKYVGTWIDSFSTSPMLMEGDYDKATHTLTMSGKSFDPGQGKEVEFKNVGKHNDDGTRTFTMYMKGDDGAWVKAMEVVYKKRAGAASDAKR
jgi:hypothetical protein